tara:strand:- start:33 stop:311 length:279 start_codon:yes stop_codon:yes gene_type:complete
MREYTAHIQVWQDAIDFNTMAQKTFGVSFNPEITYCVINGEQSPLYGYIIKWGIHDDHTHITTNKIKQMCRKLPYGHHITDSLCVGAMKEPA